jgi:hypothetical protein
MTDHDTPIRCNHDCVAAEVVDGEAIVLNLETGTYYSLDGAGARVWQLVERGYSIGAIARTIAREYDAAPADVDRDVAALVAALVDERLVIADPALTADVNVGVAADVTGLAPDASRAYQRPELRTYTEMADMLALDPPLPGLRDIEWKRTPKE